MNKLNQDYDHQIVRFYNAVNYHLVKNDELKIREDKEIFWNWINQNYISKEQILKLECLKEEEFDESDDVIDEEVREKRNQLRKEIIDEINNLLKKHETIQNKK